MKPRAAVPFYPNLPDDTHCFQAAFRMMFGHFLPDRSFSWHELETMSAKAPGKSTWPAQMLINARQMGFDVVLIEAFDAQAFSKEGATYLRRKFGAETAKWQTANSDIPQEQKLYRQMLKTDIAYERRVPTIDDIRHYLQAGYLVKLTVNSRRLNHKPGYIGHSIVVYAIDNGQVIFHDPGLPGHEARTEAIADLEAAWADPNEQAKELIAIRYKEPL
jgi:hypothetical protein